MPEQHWNKKRERQYEHVKSSEKKAGRSNDRAEEIAARTVNKARARSGESKTASRESLDDMSSAERGGHRSHSGPGERTKDQLYAEAKRKNVHGRSKMDKDELKKALAKK